MLAEPHVDGLVAYLRVFNIRESQSFKFQYWKLSVYLEVDKPFYRSN